MSHINEFKHHILRPYYAIKTWYYNHFVSFIELCAATEHYYISRRLWEHISHDDPDSSEYTIFFEKYIRFSRSKTDTPYRYRFFVNPDLSTIKASDGEAPYTCQLQLSRFGHMGFQCVQPTPIEILTNYDIATPDFVTHHLDRRVRLRVKTYKVNGSTAFELIPNSSLFTPHSSLL